MSRLRLKPLAVIWDVYGTLLDLAPPPADAEARWAQAFHRHLGLVPPLGPEAFTRAARTVINRLHSEARSHGIPWPEIWWPAVVAEVLPAVRDLAGPSLDALLLELARTGRSTRMTRTAAAVLRALHDQGATLGIASNAQGYTLRELGDALAGHALDPAWFDPALCFWSFQHGFSKPDPHVFRLLRARLEARGIAPAATLMVGDRLDNDVEPARAQGWQAWHLTDSAGQTWTDLARHLESTGWGPILPHP